jgi:hypothetical protein
MARWGLQGHRVKTVGTCVKLVKFFIYIPLIKKENKGICKHYCSYVCKISKIIHFYFAIETLLHWGTSFARYF